MTAKRDLISEIEEIRGRTGSSDFDNGITKLLFLSTHVQKLTQETEEQLYFPIACVAALEAYFRWEIRKLIDSGNARFIENLRVDELQPKIDHDLILAISGKRITIGELISHSVKFHNLDGINGIMSQLLRADFLDLVKNARDPEERRKQGENAPPMLHSVGDTLANIKRTFYLRHIICHEGHLGTAAKLDEIKALCHSCYDFARASRYAIAYYENPNAPLTLDEAFKAAIGRVKDLKAQVKELEDLMVSKIRHSPMEEAFREMQEAWRLSVNRQAGFDGSHHMNGNRGALYEQLTIEDLYRKRLDEIKRYAENY